MRLPGASEKVKCSSRFAVRRKEKETEVVNSGNRLTLSVLGFGCEVLHNFMLGQSTSYDAVYDGHGRDYRFDGCCQRACFIKFCDPMSSLSPVRVVPCAENLLVLDLLVSILP
jgi:hypothetical protein